MYSVYTLESSNSGEKQQTSTVHAVVVVVVVVVVVATMIVAVGPTFDNVPEWRHAHLYEVSVKRI
jgi:hypothetical protein